jgi:catechol 2,3-dioxygenase-like lactoylglutathione lyase family enzyme
MPTATAKKPAAKRAKGANGTAKPNLGKVERVILYVSDFERAVKFYTETLGLGLKHKSEGWAELATQGTEIDLHHGRDAKAKDSTSLGFSVENFDAAYAALKARGVKVGKIFSPCGGLRCACFQDPDGNNLGIEGK